MPRIKRWGPFAHGFNRDPQVRELRRQFGDWMALVWLELCAIGDLNGGIIKGTAEQIGESLAYISMTKRPSLSAKCITNALRFMEICGWIAIQVDSVLIVNHLKYHPFENAVAVPPNDRTTERPILKSSEPPKNHAKAAPSVVSKDNKQRPGWWDQADKVYQRNKSRFARLMSWGHQAERRGYNDREIITTLVEFDVRDQKSPIDTWWPYLETVIKKVSVRLQQSMSEQEKAANHKFVEAVLARALPAGEREL